MKKYLKILLCTLVLLLSSFTLFRIDANANAKSADIEENVLIVPKKETNTIKKVNNNTEKTKVENKRVEKSPVAKSTTTQKPVQNSKPIQKNRPTTKVNTVRYGTFGRLYVPGYSVALYDYNVNTQSSSSLQTIVNNKDSAAYYVNRGKLIIADHYYQGFSVLANLNVGANSYIKFKDGTTIRYRLIKKARGVNTGPDLKDTNGNSFLNMNSDIIMYTCYGDGIMVTLWALS